MLKIDMKHIPVCKCSLHAQLQIDDAHLIYTSLTKATASMLFVSLHRYTSSSLLFCSPPNASPRKSGS